MDLREARRRTLSTMDVVPHLVIDIPIPGVAKKKHVVSDYEALIDSPIKPRGEKYKHLSHHALPMLALIKNDLYWFPTVSLTLIYAKKGMGDFLKKSLSSKGWHLFSDGTCMWRDGMEAPDCVRELIKGMEPRRVTE